MPIKGKGLTEYRNVIVTFDDGVIAQGACPIDAYKACLKKVEEIEAQYAKTGAFTDLAGVDILVYGTVANQVHVVTATTTIASGDYEFVYVETVANPESVS